MATETRPQQIENHKRDAMSARPGFREYVEIARMARSYKWR
jgi:hypothetical protein